MKTYLATSVFILLFILVQCAGSRYLKEPSRHIAGVQWSEDVYPIMETHCTPCHFPEKGKVSFLHRRDSVERYMEEILWRVQLPKDHKDYMPYEQKKPPLSDHQLQLLLNWKAQGYPE